MIGMISSLDIIAGVLLLLPNSVVVAAVLWGCEDQSFGGGNSFLA
jgi:hypothetical protein